MTPAFRRMLKAAKTSEEVAGIAKEHGHEFTADKLTELSEDELERVAGGFCLMSCDHSNCVGSLP